MYSVAQNVGHYEIITNCIKSYKYSMRDLLCDLINNA